ncbi:MAG: Alpha-D-kanosaminyltransferase [Chloroflexi bacterium ADurb.Bin325]|nr:MAG: Alpha-D-kanosaminyltransferase [Chloroflexi bacterium ADurb.Bin325]
MSSGRASSNLAPSRRVGLNAHLLSLTQSYRGAGINGYIYQLLRHLPEAADEGRPFHFIAYLHEPAFIAPAGLSVVRSRWDTRSPWRRIAWEQTQLARHTRNTDLLHGLAFAAPLAAACPTVITVHDLSFLRYPHAFRAFNRRYLSLFTRLSARRAARVIAVSESTRQDVIALCGVPGERVVTVHNGVGAEFRPAAAGEVAAFRAARGLPDRFILFLGTLEPRKNLRRLLEAYAKLRGSQGTALPPLVIAGGKGWFYEEIYAAAAELGLLDAVSFPGFIPVEDLPWWYRAAELFVYPSIYEGFGLPVLEAMACGAPVITSTASSLPEVAGDAALLVPPDDAAALADAMHRVLAAPALRAQMREAGPRQAARFSWRAAAHATAEVYRTVLGLPAAGGAP